MNGSMQLGLFLIGFWTFLAPDLPKEARQLIAFSFFCAAVTVLIKLNH